MNEVVITSDDSSSIYSDRFKALYHSKHGAIQESQHVFIQSGLHHYIKNRSPSSLSHIRILELGFGSGLNALLSLIEASQLQRVINYTSLEAYPLDMDLIQQLNYTDKVGFTDEFKIIHNAEWNTKVEVNEYFTITKSLTLFEEFNSEEKYDVIYFDAFAPNAQKELWDLVMMKKMYSLSQNGSILVTYCAKGNVRRTMLEAGFEVSRIPGPPGKREMLRAIRTS